MPKQSKKPRVPALTPEFQLTQFEPDTSAPTIYASSINLVVSGYDFMLILAQAGLSAEGLRLRQVGTLILAPGHAKVLADILSRKVDEYEATNGKIPLPQGSLVV